MLKSKLIQNIEKIAPPNLALDWDNTGVQIDVGEDTVKRALVALEITDAVIREAQTVSADYIITHHPLLFHKIQRVDGHSVTGSQIIRLIRAGISVYSAHTSFDAVYGGNNDYLAELLDLRKIRRFQPKNETPDQEIIGKIGDLSREMSLAEVCALLQERLEIRHSLPVVGNPESRIQKVGLCTGGGGDMIEDAVRNACSLFITGDVRHHEALLAEESGICLINAGHFGTEWIFVKNFAGRLKTAVGDVVEVVESRMGKDPFRYL
ncbi:MAG: Nif3-like dinuclear metal center hexameric protein [Clostridiales Family XIII bacterium]|jgi:dinuclear metal center YbgI/SA1388 family protein|nr:Nif3-like dinuclear metal center hexameric protein [Clostridiales Family XIII bacterium]